MIKFFKTLSKIFGIDFFNMTYTLKDDEKELWNSIVEKAERGNKEFIEDCIKRKEDMGWPWMSPNLTKEESEFLDNLHYKFFGLDYIVDPIGCAQADYAWYDEVKDRIIL